MPVEHLVCIPFRNPFDFGGWIALTRYLRLRRPDLVITHLWFSNFIGRIAGVLIRLRVLPFEHNVYDTVKTWKQFASDRLLQHMSRDIIAVSAAVKESLIRHGISDRKISVVENGISLSRYRDAVACEQFDMSEGPHYLFVGRLIRQKGVDVLLRAFQHVRGTLLIAGDGVDRESLTRLARETGIEERVSFLGIRHDIPCLMKSSWCVVLPSRWEGQGLVIPEAYAAGTPVIVTDFPAAQGLVEDGVQGFVVPREDASSLASALKKIADPSQHAVLARNAAAAAARFSIERHIDIVLSYA